DALERQMCGSEYGEQDRKAAILYEYETFKAIEGEYTLMRQTNNLMDINIDALYNILKQNQEFVKTDDKKVVKKADEKKRDLSKVKCYNYKKEGHFAKDYKKAKTDDKKVVKKADEKKRDLSKVKCYNCKKEGHFAKDYKKAKVKYYNHYKTKMLLAKKDSDEQVLLAEDQAWMESSSDSDQEINANTTSSAYDCNDAMNVSCNSRLYDSFDENNLFTFDDVSVRNSPVSQMSFRKKPRDSLNVRSKRETSSAYVCNDAMNVSCDSRMNDLLVDNNFFIFDDESVRISPVSKMPFRKKPCNSMNVRSKSNMNKSLPRTVHKWLPKMQPLAESVAKCSVDELCGKFLGTVRFGNNDFAVIAGYGDVVIGSMTIKKVYYVEGLGHNLFSIGKFCDEGLEVAFQKSTCFVRNEDGVDLLTGDRSSNLYTIALNEVASNSSTCLLEKASSLQSWLFIRNITIPKQLLLQQYLLHMDLYGEMKRYVLVVVDDYSRYTWIFFLHSKDEASDVIISFIKKTQVNLQLQVQRVRTDNGTEFKNKTLAKFFDEVGITQQFSAARTPQQNGVVERRNQTLVEAARTMLTFANLPSFLWAEAIATACFTQNCSVIHKRFDKTPYELINKRKANIKFFCMLGCRCYLLNDYEDVGKLKAKGDIEVFISYSKEFAAFRIYNKRTRNKHKSMNVNFDEISEMASKQFSLEPVYLI
nr:hypothetical protein [Tanacetum cinerariifolium]